MNRKNKHQLMQMTEEERRSYYDELRKDSNAYALTTAKHFKIIAIATLVTAFIYYGLDVKEVIFLYFISLLGLVYISIRILVGSMGTKVECMSEVAREQLHLMYIALLIIFISGGFQVIDKVLKSILT